ncbi:hypothetical protein SG34_031345 [Thalassomonas viridans]|uniref:Sulfotransferase family protein n=1 Tax=Thalassomonas viridans TaxID=137584 RepID=A0AAE9Z9M2_9GAMM|nr:hypothetical protein [Thalassomonas viridans]WDE09261.1 hypothetical protein SG34_031345 [Thalassomonas viridans]
MSQISKEELNLSLASIADGKGSSGRIDDFFRLYRQYLEQHYQVLPVPGKVLFVVGTGRNGSTSFAQALRRLPASLITHERPPLVYWQKAQASLAFHIRFIEMSRQYFSVVGDVSHWWLPHLHTLRLRFGHIYVINLHRDSKATVDSFIKVKSRSGKSFNHWLAHDGRLWSHDPWDPCYPDIPLPGNLPAPAETGYQEAASHYGISRYVQDYHNRAQAYVAKHHGLNLELSGLFTEAGRQKLQQFLGVPVCWEQVHYNKQTTYDSARMEVFY